MIFLIPRNMSEFFTAPYGPHISLFFLLTYFYWFLFLFLLISHLFTPADITASGSCSVKQLPLIVYDRYSGIDLLAESELWFSSDKDNPWEWSFLGNFHTCKIMRIHWRIVFFLFPITFNPFLPLTVFAGMLDFTALIIVCLFTFKATTYLGRRKKE